MKIPLIYIGQSKKLLVDWQHYGLTNPYSWVFVSHLILMNDLAHALVVYFYGQAILMSS